MRQTCFQRKRQALPVHEGKHQWCIGFSVNRHGGNQSGVIKPRRKYTTFFDIVDAGRRGKLRISQLDFPDSW